MKRLLAALALVALFVARDTPAAQPSYVVTWTVMIVPGMADPSRTRFLTGLGFVDIWTYEALMPDGHAPPLPQTLLYRLEIPLTCAGRLSCVLATLPIEDPDILRRVIVSTWAPDDWVLEDAPLDVSAKLTRLTGPI